MKYKHLSLILLAACTGVALAGCSKGPTSYKVTASTGEGYLVTYKDTAVANQDYTFTVALNEGYEKGAAFAVSVNDTTYTESAGVYTVPKVTSDLAITVAGVEKMSYGVTYESGTGYTLAGPSSVLYNEELKGVSVTFADHYQASSSFAVKANGDAMSKDSDGTYSIKGVKKAIKVTATGVELAGYMVNHTEDAGILFTGESVAVEGADYTFSLAFTEGYEGTMTVTASMGGTSITPVDNKDGTYTIAGVNGAITIHATGATLKHFAVTKPSSAGYTFTGADEVVYGTDYSFTLALATGYIKDTDFAVSATVGGVSAAVTTGENDGYVVKNVTAALVINIAGVNKEKFAVTKPLNEFVDFAGEDKATYGEDYIFTVAPKLGYKKTAEYSVTVNGVAATATANENEYKVSAVTGALLIVVDGVEEISYSVTFVPDVADSLTNTTDAYLYSAESYSFDLGFAENYTQSKESASLVVSYKVGSDNAKTLTKNADGTYTIANPHADITINVSGIAINKYTATFVVNGTTVSSVEVPANTAVDASSIAAAVSAGSTSISSGQKIIGWDKAFDPMSADTTYNAIVADPVSDAAGVKALSGESGNYYLANDIDLISLIGNPIATDFKGLLDGQGHRIYSTKEFRDSNDGGIFAGTLTGTVRNLTAEIYPDTVEGYTENSPFAKRIGEGALIENVVIKTSYSGVPMSGTSIAQSSGALCCYFDGGTAKNVTIYISTPSFNSAADKVGGVCYRLAAGAKMENVKVLCPEGMTYTGFTPYVILDGEFTPDLSGYTLGSDGAKKVMENPLKIPGYTSSGTYNGMPYYSGTVASATGYQILDRTMDVDVYQELRFYVRSSVAATFTGAGYVKVGPDRWTMVKFSRVDGNTHKIVSDYTDPSCNTSTDTGYGFGSVFAISADATIDVTPVYVTEAATGAYTQVAASAFAGSTAVDGCNYQSKAGLVGVNDGGSWGQACFNTTDFSAYSTVKFALLFEMSDGSHGSHGVDVEANSGKTGGKGSLSFNSAVWVTFVLTKTSGSGASSVWHVTTKWYNADNSAVQDTNADTVTGAALSDFFTYNAYLSYVGYSTPIFAA